MNSIAYHRLPEQCPPGTAPCPTPLSTGAIVLSCLMALFLGSGESASALAKSYALWIGAGLAISLLFDFQKGMRNLIRADILCLLALYFLTLAEFLFPQPEFDILQAPETTLPALQLVAAAYMTFAAARHLIKPTPLTHRVLQFGEPHPSTLFLLFSIATFLAYFHMFIAVHFNPVRFFEAMIGPRFEVPWQRGRLGGWKELLNEFGLLLNVLPALAAMLWHQREYLSRLQIGFIVAVLLMTLFYGFAGGTRNVFAGFLASFLGGYLLVHPRLSLKSALPAAGAVAALFLFASYHMLEFRNIGLQKYVKGEVYASGETRETLFVDYNLHAIAELHRVFPERFGHLGFEIPFWALVKPIPRAIWKGKPEGLSVGIEEAMGLEGVTISTTYIGEAYMSFGLFGVIAFSILFGAASAWWNRLNGIGSSMYSLLVYASGFVAFAISMRSMLWFTTAILPAVALVTAHWYWLRRTDRSVPRSPNHLPTKERAGSSEMDREHADRY